MFNLDYFILSFLLAVLAFIYTNVLTQAGEVFGALYSKLYRYFKSDEREQQGLPKHPLFKVLIDCEKCVAGQIAMWSYLIINFNQYICFISVLKHFLFVSLTIFAVIIIKSIYTKFLE